MFIPIEKRNNNKRGFAFVRFATLREAEKAIELAEGRSWGGKKIQQTWLSSTLQEWERGSREAKRKMKG